MDLLERLRDPRPLLLDGAMGTALIERGLKLGEDDDAIRWSTRRRGEVLAVHRAHVEAGSELVLADTFGARAATMAELTAAVQIAKESGARWTAIPLWPGLPGGVFAQLVRNASRAGADAIWLETGMQLADAERSLRIARGETDLPVAVTLALAAFPSQPQQGPALQAQELIGVLGDLARRGAAMVGLNCGPWALPRSLDLPRLIEAIDGALGVPLILKPDAGTRTPEGWAALVARCVRAGARLSGGCCGAGAEHLRALTRELERAPLDAQSVRPI